MNDEVFDVAYRALPLSSEDKKLLEAIQESPYRLSSVEQLKEFPNNTDFFVLEPDMRSLEDLGWRYLEQHLDIPLSPELRQGIDPRPFGQIAMDEDEGYFTKYGYLSLSGDEWLHERVAEHSPTEKPSIRHKVEQCKKAAPPAQTTPHKEKSVPER